MDTNKLIESWKQEEQKPFSGWDFSYLAGRMLEDQAPWSYTTHSNELLDKASAVLDLGTGGGEQLLKMKDHWPAKVVATEEYPPNYTLATENLSSFGIQVFDVSQNMETIMPFTDEEFDLVLNRHSGFNAAEVARVLSHGGTYFTQQVHGHSGADLVEAFGAELPYPYATPEFFGTKLKEAGMTIIDTREWTGRTIYADVGAIVYHLKVVPWTVEGFSVETHLDYLLKLQQRLENGEGLVFTFRLYLIEACKP